MMIKNRMSFMQYGALILALFSMNFMEHASAGSPSDEVARLAMAENKSSCMVRFEWKRMGQNAMQLEAQEIDCKNGPVASASVVQGKTLIVHLGPGLVISNDSGRFIIRYYAAEPLSASDVRKLLSESSNFSIDRAICFSSELFDSSSQEKLEELKKNTGVQKINLAIGCPMAPVVEYSGIPYSRGNNSGSSDEGINSHQPSLLPLIAFWLLFR